MRRHIRQIFRPEYGTDIVARPKNWWSPKARKSARIAAAVANHHWPETRDLMTAKMVESMVYGTPPVFTEDELRERMGL